MGVLGTCEAVGGGVVAAVVDVGVDVEEDRLGRENRIIVGVVRRTGGVQDGLTGYGYVASPPYICDWRLEFGVGRKWRGSMEPALIHNSVMLAICKFCHVGYDMIWMREKEHEN